VSDAISLNEENRAAWDANASVWDARMGDAGNDFFSVLEWPAIVRLLDSERPRRVLDVACGNGLTARHLAALGATVTAFDFSARLVEIARERSAHSTPPIAYHVLDATDERALRTTLCPAGPFDAAVCNMALFDIADIEPLFSMLPDLLRPDGVFVFTLTHPAFNNASCSHVAEERDAGGKIETAYSIKVSRYMMPQQARGLALRDQPVPQVYFDRPLQYYLNLGFRRGFVLDGFEERAFPADHPQSHPLGWGGRYSEIPPVLTARFRRR
jgi:SAM-dependent methyltransferase